MGRKASTAQLELLTRVRHASLPPRQAFMATCWGTYQLLLDLPLDKPLIDHTNEDIIALVKRAFRSAKRALPLNRSVGSQKRKL